MRGAVHESHPRMRPSEPPLIPHSCIRVPFVDGFSPSPQSVAAKAAPTTSIFDRKGFRPEPPSSMTQGSRLKPLLQQACGCRNEFRPTHPVGGAFVPNPSSSRLQGRGGICSCAPNPDFPTREPLDGPGGPTLHPGPASDRGGLQVPSDCNKICFALFYSAGGVG
jgi:hypothetical protein